MPQDTFQRAKERYEDAREAWRENFERMREDLRFTDPSEPQQWDQKTIDKRNGRLTLTLDQTNQFIQQVVNDARQNTPSLTVTPGDYLADKRVALKQSERLRYLEYASRAAIAYDTSVEYSARCGIGWIRVIPTVVDSKLNWQEPRILAVHDPLSCLIDGDSVEFDGSDAVDGYVEARMSERAFKRKFPKAKIASFGDSPRGWVAQDGLIVAEWMHVEVTRGNKIVTGDPETGANQVEYTEDGYWEAAAKLGYKPHVISTDPQAELDRKVMWRKMSGCEILEETEYPCKWIGLLPVYGQVVWVDGKRKVSGLSRRLMDGQRFHNIMMSSLAENLLEQPKAPFMASARAIKGHESHWAQLNNGNPSYLPFNDMPTNADDPPIEKPQRLGPPAFPAAFANGATLGVQEMQASVGMFKSNLGQQSNAVSGRAKIADKIEGDTATFHYVDNQRRTLEHLGRVLLDMEGRLNDSKRTLPTRSVDDKSGTVVVDPDMREAVAVDARGQVVAINPSIGRYDARVKVGPGYTTVREELKERLVQMGQTNPALAAALTPILVKLDDLPESDTIMRVCMALLPPPVQQAYKADEEGQAVPPQVAAQLQAQQAQLEGAMAMLQQMQQALAEAQQTNAAAVVEAEGKVLAEQNKAAELGIKQQEADIKRISAEADMLRARTEATQTMDVAELAALVQKTRDDVAAILGGGDDAMPAV